MLWNINFVDKILSIRSFPMKTPNGGKPAIAKTAITRTTNNPVLILLKYWSLIGDIFLLKLEKSFFFLFKFLRLKGCSLIIIKSTIESI